MVTRVGVIQNRFAENASTLLKCSYDKTTLWVKHKKKKLNTKTVQKLLPRDNIGSRTLSYNCEYKASVRKALGKERQGKL